MTYLEQKPSRSLSLVSMLEEKQQTRTLLKPQDKVLCERRLANCMTELARLGECRQVRVSEQTFLIYSEELMHFDERDVQAALRDLGRKPREQFQTSFPDLATVLAACKKARNARIETMFPPRPVLLSESPNFEACEGPHFWVRGERMAYLDADGNPVSIDQAQEKALHPCRCSKEFRLKRRQWESEVWAPHMRAYREWEETCDEIRRKHSGLSEVA